MDFDLNTILATLGVVALLHVVLFFALKGFINGTFNIKRKYPCPAPSGAVVITGASSGIGFAAAVHLAQEGHTVYAGFRSLEDERIANLQEASKNPTKIIPVVIDVTKQDTVDAAVEKISAEQEDGIVGLVNSAGYHSGPFPVEFVDPAVLSRQLDVNVTGQVRVVQGFMPLLRAGQGRVVFLSSIAGKIAGNFQGAYAASKFATEAIADSLRRELRPWNLSVSLINAGEIATPLLASYNKAAQNAKAALAQISDKAAAYYSAFYDNTRPTPEKYVGTVNMTNKAIAHALTSPYPKTRYTVAAKSMIKKHLYPPMLMGLPTWSVLPDRFFDAKMAKAQWPRKYDIPEAVKGKK